MPYNDAMYDDYEDDFLAEYGFSDDDMLSDDELYDSSKYGYEEEEEE